MWRVNRVVFAVLCLMFVGLGLAAMVAPPASPTAPTYHPLLAKPSVRMPAFAIHARSGPGCPAAEAFKSAANDNAASLTTLAVSPFGVPETGWAVYAPLVAREISTDCAPDAAGFAARLALWQGRNAIPADGRLNLATLSSMSVLWLQRRPFVIASQKGCPPAPDEATLAMAVPVESYGGKAVLARPAALEAYRRMVQAARIDLGDNGPQLKIASAYRGPTEEAVRCALGGCGTPSKARCSAHRTGLAFDFYLGAAPGSDGFATDAANRLYLSQTATYRWLVAHADRFGFVNYPYEPWHWEWTGEAI